MRKTLCSAMAAAMIASVAAGQQVHLPGSLIQQFVDPLPLLDVAGGPIKTVIAGTEEIAIHMREFRADVMPTGFVGASGVYAGTWSWGYVVGPQAPKTTLGTYLGPVIIATRGVPTQVRWVNDLGTGGTSNVLAWYRATDQTLHWADPLNAGANMCHHLALQHPTEPPTGFCATNYAGPVPAVVHLHGGEVPPVLDGGPDAWFTSDGAFRGSAYYTRPGFPAPANAAVYRYPNSQEAAPAWIHDHALGITRLNVYAGLAGGYLITDPGLQLPAGLHPIGLQQGASGDVTPIVPLIIQDRMFDVNGQLFFPNEGDNPLHPYWVPEFEGDTIVVNGKVWPYLEVEPRRYRFLIINGSNARPYSMFLSSGQGNQPGPAIWQIGTDGGYLDAPVRADAGGGLVVLPGERADIIIDFAGSAGAHLLLRNNARIPYPFGTPPNGQTTGRIVQFRVKGGSVTDSSYDPASGLPIRSGGQQVVRLANPLTGTLAPGVTVARVRQLTLNEVMGANGPMAALLNNTAWQGPNRPDFTAVTVGGATNYISELPAEGTTEIWEIVNLTEDAHPIHTHLTQVQVLNRQRFQVRRYHEAYESSFPEGKAAQGSGPPLNYGTGNPRALGGNPDITPFLRGPVMRPAANEAGWKDTVVMPPGQVTRIVIRYAPLDTPVNASGPHYLFDPAAGGHGYVWHCHMLEHEDNEMMRPYYVIPQAGAKRTFRFGIDY